MSRYKVLLFDLDGTLMDTAPGIINTLKYTMKKMGLEEPDDLRKFLGPPLFRSMKDFCGLDDERAREATRIYREEYPKDELFNSKVFEGIEELLKALRADGLTVGVATSKPEPFAKSLLERFGMAKYFDCIGGSGVKSAKDTKSDVIERVLEELGQPDRSSVLMIGDRVHDAAGAEKCGIDCLYVLWGYGSPEEAAQCGAKNTAVSTEDCRRFIMSTV